MTQKKNDITKLRAQTKALQSKLTAAENKLAAEQADKRKSALNERVQKLFQEIASGNYEQDDAGFLVIPTRYQTEYADDASAAMQRIASVTDHLKAAKLIYREDSSDRQHVPARKGGPNYDATCSADMYDPGSPAYDIVNHLVLIDPLQKDFENKLQKAVIESRATKLANKNNLDLSDESVADATRAIVTAQLAKELPPAQKRSAKRGQ